MQFTTRITLFLTIVAQVFLINACGMNNTSDLNEVPKPKPDLQIAKIERAIQSVQGIPYISDRLTKASEQFLDSPYLDAPLGEGEEAPLYRGDSFDCTTFVETMVAIARSHNLDEFKVIMNRIRYKDGNVSLLTRNHMPDVDWTVNNIAAGFFRDMTNDFSQAAVSPLLNNHVVIDRKQWFKLVYKIDVEREPQAFDIPYVAMHDIFVDRKPEQREKVAAIISEHAAKEKDFITRISATTDPLEKQAIRDEWRAYVKNLDLTAVTKENPLAAFPNAAVLNLVAINYKIPKVNPVTDIGIGHQALLVRDAAGNFLVREASKTWKKVTDTPVTNYFLSKETNSVQKGIQILTLQNPN